MIDLTRFEIITGIIFALALLCFAIAAMVSNEVQQERASVVLLAGV